MSEPLLARLARAAKLGLVGATLLLGGAITQAQTLGSTTLASLPDPSRAIDRGGAAKPIAAWLDFCQRYP